MVYQNYTGHVARGYAGGIGIYVGPLGLVTSGLLGTKYRDVTVVGGKIFVGADFTSTAAIEAAAHFAGGQALSTLQLRLKL